MESYTNYNADIVTAFGVNDPNPELGQAVCVTAQIGLKAGSDYTPFGSRVRVRVRVSNPNPNRQNEVGVEVDVEADVEVGIEIEGEVGAEL